MKVIYLIRHSKPIDKQKLKYISFLSKEEKNRQIPLSLDGQKKAYEMAKKFKNKIDHVWSSTYERAISTAKYVAEMNDKEINICSLFDERKLGRKENIPEEFWIEQLKNENAKIEDSESRIEVTNRMISGIKLVLESTKEGQSSIVVTHATAMTFLLMKWCELKKADLNGKKRWLVFKNKDIINGSFNTPEIFKLSFLHDEILDIERIV